MKTLYISDLDGTLLNTDAELSPYTRDVIRRFTASGGYFTAATARTRETVRFILEDAGINVPAVVMNGVMLYDLCEDKLLSPNYISADDAEAIAEAVDRFALSGFLYMLRDGKLVITYKRLETPSSRAFVEERVRKYNKVFTKVEDLSRSNVVSFCAAEPREILDPVAEALKNRPGLEVAYHQDVYNTGLWYLDVCAAGVSKSSALDIVRREYGFDKVVAFGDNHNDMPLFAAADECYAVGNAVDGLKAVATGVIGRNTEDGVARWIEENLLGEGR
jgi:Cof subfamily protein (haloacid dehalogenase superfamily)